MSYKVTNINREDLPSSDCQFVIESSDGECINESVANAIIAWFNIFCEAVKIVSQTDTKIEVNVTHPFVSGIYESLDTFCESLSI